MDAPKQPAANDDDAGPVLDAEQRAALKGLVAKLDGYIKLTRLGAAGASKLRQQLTAERNQTAALLEQAERQAWIDAHNAKVAAERERAERASATDAEVMPWPV